MTEKISHFLSTLESRIYYIQNETSELGLRELLQTINQDIISFMKFSEKQGVLDGLLINVRLFDEAINKQEFLLLETEKLKDFIYLNPTN